MWDIFWGANWDWREKERNMLAIGWPQRLRVPVKATAMRRCAYGDPTEMGEAYLSPQWRDEHREAAHVVAAALMENRMNREGGGQAKADPPGLI